MLLAPAPGIAHDEDKGQKLGTVRFDTSCSPAAQKEFNHGVALLHSFWFPMALASFDEVAKIDPACGMAHWGTAMSWWGNPLAGPPIARGLKEGAVAAERAKTVGAKTPREMAYIDAVGAFYKDADKVDHRTRALAYERAMEAITVKYPDDTEAQIFYALALNITFLPTDKTYANQLKAAALLEKVFAAQADHPGVAHYLIHSYDFPPIAAEGPAGRAALRLHRAVGAARAAHALAHLHPRGRLGGVHRVQPRLRESGAQRARGRAARVCLVQRAPRHGLHGVRLPAARP